ncbi:hypothetical protein ACP70R_008064 [Stipagrostis hirtigluma subsp. patula]
MGKRRRCSFRRLASGFSRSQLKSPTLAHALQLCGGADAPPFPSTSAVRRSAAAHRSLATTWPEGPEMLVLGSLGTSVRCLPQKTKTVGLRNRARPRSSPGAASFFGSGEHEPPSHDQSFLREQEWLIIF